MATYAEARQFCLDNPFEFALEPEYCVLPSESADTLADLRAAFRADNLPLTVTEEILVNEMADNHWRIRRCREFEAMALADLANLEVWNTQMAAMSKLAASAERSFHRAVKVLRELQKERGFHPAANRIHRLQAANLQPPPIPQERKGPACAPPLNNELGNHAATVSRAPQQQPAQQQQPAPKPDSAPQNAPTATAPPQPAASPAPSNHPAEARRQFVSQNAASQNSSGFVSQNTPAPHAQHSEAA